MDGMTLNEYQQSAMSTAVYKTEVPKEQHLDYTLLGLGGEAGELLNKRKKWLRGDFKGVESAIAGVHPAELAILNELADVLWYVAAVADELGTSLHNVASLGLEKLRKRQAAGTLASGATSEDR